MKRYLWLVFMVAIFSCSGSTDQCSKACKKLQSCEMCIQDAYGQCLSTNDCTKLCKENKGQDEAKCINKVKGCDGYQITACLQGGGAGDTRPNKEEDYTMEDFE